jgi:hypothetical protein
MMYSLSGLNERMPLMRICAAREPGGLAAPSTTPGRQDVNPGASQGGLRRARRAQRETRAKPMPHSPSPPYTLLLRSGGRSEAQRSVQQRPRRRVEKAHLAAAILAFSAFPSFSWACSNCYFSSLLSSSRSKALCATPKLHPMPRPCCVQLAPAASSMRGGTVLVARRALQHAAARNERGSAAATMAARSGTLPAGQDAPASEQQQGTGVGEIHLILGAYCSLLRALACCPGRC